MAAQKIKVRTLKYSYNDPDVIRQRNKEARYMGYRDGLLFM